MPSVFVMRHSATGPVTSGFQSGVMQQGSTGGANITLTFAGVVVGDLLLVSGHSTASTTLTAPVGWTLVRHDDTATGSNLGRQRSTVWYRIATAGDGASPSFTFSSPGSNQNLARLIGSVYRGPTAVTAGAAQLYPDGSYVEPLSLVAPSVTPPAGLHTLVSLFQWGHSAGSTQPTGVATPPAGMTLRRSAGGTYSHVATYDELVTGATGTRTAVPNSMSITVAIASSVVLTWP